MIIMHSSEKEKFSLNEKSLMLLVILFTEPFIGLGFQKIALRVDF